MVNLSVSYLLAAIISAPTLATYVTPPIANTTTTIESVGATIETASTTNSSICHQDAEMPDTCDGSNGWYPVSVVGKKKEYFCSKGPICAGEIGNCPGAHRDLDFGSKCVMLTERVYGCVSNTECPTDSANHSVPDNCEVTTYPPAPPVSNVTEEVPYQPMSNETATLPSPDYTQETKTFPPSPGMATISPENNTKMNNTVPPMVVSPENATFPPYTQTNNTVPPMVVSPENATFPPYTQTNNTVPPMVVSPENATFPPYTQPSTEQPSEATPAYETTQPPTDAPEQQTEGSAAYNTLEPYTEGSEQQSEDSSAYDATDLPTVVPVQQGETPAYGSTEPLTDPPVQQTEETLAYGPSEAPTNAAGQQTKTMITSQQPAMTNSSRRSLRTKQ